MNQTEKKVGGGPGEFPPPAFFPPRTLTRPADLAAAGLAPATPALEAVAARYAIAITPAVVALIDRADPADPIARQYVPDEAELVTAPWERADPTADAPFTPVKGVVHRYPDRALLKPLLACPVYCRFCFRREVVGPDGGLLTEAELDAAIAWFATTPTVREAVLTGGDPLLLSPRRLGGLLGRLAAISHLEVLRIHSRVPVADPGRITAALAASLRHDKPLFLCVHANHAREFSAEAVAGLRLLAMQGVALLGQSVLLRGVNDSTEALEGLFRAMLRAGVKPYYLHQLDAAPGTARFAVPIEKGLALLRALRGRISGLAWPTYVLEAPDGGGKAPLGPAFAAPAPGGWQITAPLGGGAMTYAQPRSGGGRAIAIANEVGVGGMVAGPVKQQRRHPSSRQHGDIDREELVQPGGEIQLPHGAEHEGKPPAGDGNGAVAQAKHGLPWAEPGEERATEIAREPRQHAPMQRDAVHGEQHDRRDLRLELGIVEGHRVGGRGEPHQADAAEPEQRQPDAHQEAAAAHQAGLGGADRVPAQQPQHVQIEQ